MTFKKTAVKLLILNYNSKSFLKGAISSLLKQHYRDSFGIIVIDNASTDGSADYLKKNFPNVAVIRNNSNLGVGEGFNQAIKKIIDTTDYIGFFNPDVVVDNNWLRYTTESLEKNQEADVCGGVILDWKGERVENAGGTIVNIFTGIFGGFLSGIKKTELPDKYSEQTFPVFFGVLTAMLVRASAFKKYGYFDKSYFMSAEEADFCWRIHSRGRKVVTNTKATIKHFSHGSAPNRKLSLFIMKQTEINILFTYYKNLSTTNCFVILIPLFFIRLFFSLSYFLFSRNIAMAKISGIALFTKNLMIRKYFNERKRVQKIRTKNDFFVLSQNPTNLFSIIPIVKSSFSWFTHLKK